MSLEQSLKDVIKEHEDKAKKGFGLGAMLEGASPFLAFINLPVAITAGVTGLAIDSLTKKKNLEKTMMPDSWLKKVAESDNVSVEGLNFLREKIGKGNTLSVSDALVFLEIENSHEKTLRQSNQRLVKKEVEDFSGVNALKSKFKNIEKKNVIVKRNPINSIGKNLIEIGPRAISLIIAIKGKGKLKK